MKTKKSLLFTKLMLCALLLLFVGTAYAADQAAGNKGQAAAPKAQMTKMAKPAKAKMAKAPVTVTGTIMANKNKAGKISSYSLQAIGISLIEYATGELLSVNDAKNRVTLNFRVIPNVPWEGSLRSQGIRSVKCDKAKVSIKKRKDGVTYRIVSPKSHQRVSITRKSS